MACLTKQVETLRYDAHVQALHLLWYYQRFEWKRLEVWGALNNQGLNTFDMVMMIERIQELTNLDYCSCTFCTAIV
jgi:hypothetical protein